MSVRFADGSQARQFSVDPPYRSYLRDGPIQGSFEKVLNLIRSLRLVSL